MSINSFSKSNSSHILEYPSLNANTTKKKTGGDRDITSRAVMERAGTAESFFIPNPGNLYQQHVVQALFPDYSTRFFSPSTSPYIDSYLRRGSWVFPKTAFDSTTEKQMAPDFYRNNIDWGQYLVGANVGNKCYVKNVETKKVEGIARGISDFTSLRWSPSGTKVFCGDIQGSLSTVDAETTQGRSITFRHKKPLYSIECYSDDQLFIGSIDKIYQVDLRVGKEIVDYFRFPGSSVLCSMKVNSDKSHLAIGTNSNQVHIFDIHNMSNGPVQSYSHRAGIKAVQWRNSTQVLSGGGTEDKILKLYDTRRQEVLCEELADAQICSMVCIDCDYYVLGMGFQADQNIQLWRFLPKKQKLQNVGGVKEQGERILDITKNPNGPEIYSHSDDGALSCWKLESTSPSQQRNTCTDKQRPFDLKTIR